MKPTTLNTRELERIEDKLATHAKRTQCLVDELSSAIYRMEQNHKNIVAAHKAHRTMERKKKGSGIDTEWMLRLLNHKNPDGRTISDVLAEAATNRGTRYRLARYITSHVNLKLSGFPNNGDPK